MPATSQTLTYSNAVALALDKLHKKIADAISTSNMALFMLKKAGNWEGVQEGGAQLRVPIMYQLQPLKPIGSYGAVNVNVTNGDTAAYFAWGQTAAHVTFTGMEDFQTRGALSLEKMVDARKRQAEASLSDIFERALIRGQADLDTSSFTTALTSDEDGSTFIDPLSKLIAYDPTVALVVGGIDQSANSWWQNQTYNSAATTRKAFLSELRTLYARCQRGGGAAINKAPDFHITDENTYTVYEAAIAEHYQSPNYAVGDIPFPNVAFKTKPVGMCELVGDVDNGSTTLTDGTWYMGNSAFLGFTYDEKDSFKVGAAVRPSNQLLTSALMPVRGALWASNRKKLGVMGDIAFSTLLTAAS